MKHIAKEDDGEQSLNQSRDLQWKKKKMRRIMRWKWDIGYFNIQIFVAPQWGVPKRDSSLTFHRQDRDRLYNNKYEQVRLEEPVFEKIARSLPRI